MKITQINNTRGIIIKSSIKKVIIDGDVENASAFKDVVITHLSADTLNIIESNSSQYRRINVSYELMRLLQKLWRNGLVPPPKVMPKFRILPTGYPSVLGLEFQITPFDNDDGLTGSMAILIKDMNTGEKMAYIPNFITQGQHRNRIKKWKKKLRDEEIDQLIIFNNNTDSDIKNVSYTEKNFNQLLKEKIEKQDSEWLQKQLIPFNPERLININRVANEKEHSVVWQPTVAKFLHYYYPNDDLMFQENQLTEDNPNFFNKDNHLIGIDENDDQSALIIQQRNVLPITTQIEEYRKQFKRTLPQSDLNEIIQIISAKETYSI